MSICPEGEYRNSLSEEEFWAYVYSLQEGPSIEEFPPDENMLEENEVNFRIDNPCSVCRSTGACSYDSEGRPMIHVVEDLESEDDV